MSEAPEKKPGLRPPWKKGQSGNPQKKGLNRPITRMLRSKLVANDSELMDQLVTVAIARAIKNDMVTGFHYFKEIMDRIDGPVAREVNRLEIIHGVLAIARKCLTRKSYEKLLEAMAENPDGGGE